VIYLFLPRKRGKWI